MKLYSNPRAPSPRRVRMFAAEKGLALTLIDIDIGARANDGDEFRAVNPRGEVPVLELDDGRRLTQSMAICRYLERLQPEPNLFGRDADECYAIDATIDELTQALYVPTVHAFRHGHEFWAGRFEQSAEYAAIAARQVRDEYQRLDVRLRDREFLCLDRLTMADVLGFTTVDFGRVCRLRPGEDLTDLLRWRDAIAARPSARA